MRCAIYARYSSDRQNERSIADQVAECTRFAESKSWTITATFSDAAISGSAMANRPGLNEALAAAERQEFDILLAEDEDRLARNLEHQAHVFNRLEDAGIRLVTIASGDVTDMHVALKGLMAQQYIRNLSAKTKRGMHSNAEKGLATGARLYGYRTEPGGRTEIVNDEADIIRRIFAAYAAGDTAREIAGSLNAEGVPGPRGGLWNASTISGSRQRGNGILNTEQYVGVKVWGRDTVKKDRQTGRRIHRYAPPEQWSRTPAPHLRIIDDETWSKVRARKDRAKLTPHQAQRRPSLFGGCCVAVAAAGPTRRTQPASSFAPTIGSGRPARTGEHPKELTSKGAFSKACASRCSRRRPRRPTSERTRPPPSVVRTMRLSASHLSTDGSPKWIGGSREPSTRSSEGSLPQLSSNAFRSLKQRRLISRRRLRSLRKPVPLWNCIRAPQRRTPQWSPSWRIPSRSMRRGTPRPQGV